MSLQPIDLQQEIPLGSIHTCDLLKLSYCVNYLLNNRLYCNKWVNSHCTANKIFAIFVGVSR